MTYDHWKTTPPDDGEEPSPEEDQGEAWEYWHGRAMSAEAEIHRLKEALQFYSDESNYTCLAPIQTHDRGEIARSVLNNSQGCEK
jgi:hypothetical protein